MKTFLQRVKNPEKTSLTQTFEWEGFDPKGIRFQGTMRAESVAEVRGNLKDQGILCKRIEKQKAKFGNIDLFPAKTNVVDIIRFTNQLAILLKAGLTIDKALSGLVDTTEKPAMKKVVSQIANDLRGGLPIVDAMSKHPEQFDRMYMSLIEVGEATATLPSSLEQLGAYLGKRHEFKKQLKKALLYPKIVFFISIGITAFLMIKVVPTFQKMYGEGGQLPPLTQFLISTSEWFQAYFLYIVVTVALLFILFKQAKARIYRFKIFIDNLLVRIPKIRDFVVKSYVAQIFRMLAGLFGAGLEIPKALEMIGNNIENHAMQESIRTVRARVMNGVSIYIAFSSYSYYPSYVLQMIATGESSGALNSMLNTAANLCEEEVEGTVDAIKGLIEPAVIIFLGILIGTVVIGMYLPVFSAGGA